MDGWMDGWMRGSDDRNSVWEYSWNTSKDTE